MSSPFLLSAVGDISFQGSESDNSSIDCFGDTSRIFHQSDLVVGNLEGALVRNGNPVQGKCTLRGCPRWASVMRNAGISLVSLANNHVMDYGEQGLFSTIEALSRAGIRYVGAGRNQREACSPLFMDFAGRRIAFLARSSVIVNTPTGTREIEAGVALLDAEETIAAIRSCRAQSDLVILLVHWGLEEYSYPSPTQRQLARELVDAGVDIILGHHPHVLQGFEYYKSALIAYSLGNFIFNEFEWTYSTPDSVASKHISILIPDKLMPENRKGIIATLEWKTGKEPIVKTIHTRIEEHGRVCVDTDPAREVEMRVLSTRMLLRWYRRWWRWYAIKREWGVRLQEQVSFRKIVTNLHRIRLRHLKELFGLLRRSVRIVSEKTTNPYD